MTEGVYRVLGKLLAVIGVFILFFPIILLIYWVVGNPGGYFLQLFDIAILTGFTMLGIITTHSGIKIYKKFREIGPFLAKNGDPIHSGKIWKKGAESGLFLTSCGRVVSTNQESKETGHVGYRIVPAKQATCSDCVIGEGKAILDSIALNRDGC
ncbi:MAG: hypothetical protein E4H14_03925 [Candidatus Thorarchaeota archaeon]|nr:MAG: hypothetical protein E4H14_03925 [Candidatus Thorarchaeota archaeon]